MITNRHSNMLLATTLISLFGISACHAQSLDAQVHEAEVAKAASADLDAGASAYQTLIARLVTRPTATDCEVPSRR